MGQGLFHTNTMEGLWSQIKRISHNFFGLNFKILDDIIKEGGNAKDYLNNWICYTLSLRECEMKKMNTIDKRGFLNKILLN